MSEIKLITLKCSNCSALLQLSDKLGRFICNYCGAEQLLVNGADGFFFKRLEDKLESLEKTTEKGNVELALKRLREDLRLKMVQLEELKIEKAEALLLLDSRKETVIGTLVSVAVCQAIVLKLDMAFYVYICLQTAILIAALYQVHILGAVQKGREEIKKKYQPDFEIISSEIAALEVKIRKKKKIVDD